MTMGVAAGGRRRRSSCPLMSDTRFKVETFDVQGSSALALYFVMAHWPHKDTQPLIDLEHSPLRLIFRSDPKLHEQLRHTLELAKAVGGQTAESAHSLLAEIDRASHRATRMGSQQAD